MANDPSELSRQARTEFLESVLRLKPQVVADLWDKAFPEFKLAVVRRFAKEIWDGTEDIYAYLNERQKKYLEDPDSHYLHLLHRKLEAATGARPYEAFELLSERPGVKGKDRRGNPTLRSRISKWAFGEANTKQVNDRNRSRSNVGRSSASMRISRDAMKTEHWRQVFRHGPKNVKYEIALGLAEKEPLDHGVVIYQDVRLLIKLRNALIHYEPMSSTSTAESSRKLEQKFQSKFLLNPLTGRKTPFFPERCLGHGCAKWAVKSSVKFVDHCLSTLEIEPVFNSVRTSLETE